MIGRGLIAAASIMALQACATDGAPADLREAVLLNADNPSVRESLRVIVREGSGGLVRVHPDSLSNSPVLRLTERPGMGNPGTRLVGAPMPVYRLLTDPEGRCYLAREGADPLISAISDAARCRAV